MARRKERILIVEDEEDILEVLRHNLAREGYEVLTATDGPEGLALAREKAPDLVLLDLMLPSLDGFELCRRLKQDPLTSGIRIVMATARTEDTDEVLGLGLGADDYVTKPFSVPKLIARVKAVLRRPAWRGDGDDGERLVYGPLAIDRARHQVLAGGRDIALTATEFRLLQVLAAHPGRVFTRDQLLNRVIGEHAIVTERNIDVHVRAIRKKLGEFRDCIETVRGVGYRFAPPADGS